MAVVKLGKRLLRAAWGKPINKLPACLVDNAELITFDVYDTLICRDCSEPSDLFRRVGKFVGDDTFYTIRKNAELAARKKSPSGETTLSDIYDEFLDLSADERNDLMAVEMDAELRSSARHFKMGALYDLLRSEGKRIAIVSDMYLPSMFIGEVLDRCGYEGYERLYVSGEYDMSKRKGDLFHLVYEELEVQPKRVLHIGDHPLSDYYVPRKMGMEAFLYREGR